MVSAAKKMNKIVIVGGGSAGWITACLLRKHLAADISIELVGAPEIATIGVGEGSTPQLRGLFNTLGIPEAEWMSACNATYKLGIEFTGWTDAPGYSRYFHPFVAQTDLHTQDVFIHSCYYRRLGLDVDANPDHYFLNAALAQQGRQPLADASFPFSVEYGYHFDSTLLGQFLATYAKSQGVTYREFSVSDVVIAEDGSINALVSAQHGVLEADFFVDCTGFSARLISQALGVKFISYSANLFNDAAVVMQTPCLADEKLMTQSTALRNGWAWRIPLTSRVGNGYVYSSKYCSAEQAEQELRAHLGVDDSVAARHLKMKVGRLEQHWYKNCLAVGLSQGFIEPLEATALHLVQTTVEMFADCLVKGNYRDALQPEFNQRINSRFEGIRDYIVGHYRLNNRTDSQYWRDNAANEDLPLHLKGLTRAWLSREDIGPYLTANKLDSYYSINSWHCLFSGYGIYPSQLVPADSTKPEVQSFLRRIDDVGHFNRMCSQHYPLNKQR